MRKETKWKLTRRQGRKFWVCRYQLFGVGRWIEETTKKTRKREAESAAKSIVQRAEQRGSSGDRGWAAFRHRYETEGLSGAPIKTLGNFQTAANKLELLCGPNTIDDLDEDMFSQFAKRLRDAKYSTNTLHAYRDHLMSALKWAKAMKLIRKKPDPPRLEVPRSAARGRPLLREELERMVMKLPDVVGKSNAVQWAWNLEGLWRSGFRLGETLVFHWEQTGSMHFVENLDGERPRIVIDASCEKGHRNRTMPMTPDFAAMLREVPRQDRIGAVFKWPLTKGNTQSVKTIGKRISLTGEKARVVVGKRTKRFRPKKGEPAKPPKTVEQYGSAHCIRKAFGTRWAPMVMPVVLKEMMRHSSIETTLKYYVGLEADKVGDILWRAQGAVLGDMLDSLVLAEISGD